MDEPEQWRWIWLGAAVLFGMGDQGAAVGLGPPRVSYGYVHPYRVPDAAEQA